LAVPGISCISPIAPFGDTASLFPADSAAITLRTSAAGSPYLWAAASASSMGVGAGFAGSAAIFGGGTGVGAGGSSMGSKLWTRAASISM
jgi:hypothetical protein